jgi:hypothetical protein
VQLTQVSVFVCIPYDKIGLSGILKISNNVTRKNVKITKVLTTIYFFCQYQKQHVRFKCHCCAKRHVGCEQKTPPSIKMHIPVSKDLELEALPIVLLAILGLCRKL